MPFFTRLWTFSVVLGQRKHFSLLLVFTSAVLITVAFWAVLPETYRINESSDYKSFYEPVARNITAGKGITNSSSSSTASYPPGFPILLAGVYKVSQLLGISDSHALSAFVLFCEGFAAVLIFLIAREVGGGGAGSLASLLWMTYPFGLWLTKQPNSEVPFMVFLYASVYLFVRLLGRKRLSWFEAGSVGLLSGVSVLIRPISVGLPLLFAIAGFRLRNKDRIQGRLKLAGLVLVGALLPVLPWQLWLGTISDGNVILSTSGIPGIRDGLTFAVDDKGYRNSVAVPPDVENLMLEISRKKSAGRMESAGDLLDVLKLEARERPFTLVKLALLKGLRSWYATDSSRLEVLAAGIQLPYLALILWGGMMSIKQCIIKRQFVVLVALIALYFWAMTTLVLSILRYMVPAIGLMLTLIPIGFSHWRNIRTSTSEPETKFQITPTH